MTCLRLVFFQITESHILPYTCDLRTKITQQQGGKIQGQHAGTRLQLNNYANDDSLYEP